MLKDLIATRGEAVAGKIIREFRFSGDARKELYDAIVKAVDEECRIAHEIGVYIGKDVMRTRLGHGS
jgi:hypothetical protein